ncbi:MAG: hypothetical protein J0M04_03825 [Verrucomicrobia bacterium]|nr:hypothetical protein [Verrucomicrobiota bacterium]
MKTLIASAMLIATTAKGGDILRQSHQLAPEDLNILKWEFRQKTDSVTGAVMRVEREICGTIVDEYEEVNYWPDKEDLGSLLVFNSETPQRIVLPGGNRIIPEVDKHLGNISQGRESIKGVDGVERDSTFVQFQGEHETVRIFFYTAPFAIYRKELKELPDTTDGKISGFRWTYPIVEMEYVIQKDVLDGKERVSVVAGPNKAAAGRSATRPGSKPEGRLVPRTK